MNEHLHATLAQSFQEDIRKVSSDTRSRKRCNDFVNIPIHWIDSKFFYIRAKVKLTTAQAESADENADCKSTSTVSINTRSLFTSAN